jgi:FAD/FMN-containing dehydrogenase
MSATLSRRNLLRAGITASGLLAAGVPAAWGAVPDGFPAGVPVTTTTFKNWCGAIDVPGLWTASPRHARDVVDIVNWAHRRGWKVRPKGAMHGWSPLTVTQGTHRHAPVMLVDTARLRRLSLTRHRGVQVHAGAGTPMIEMLRFLIRHGLGLSSVPATGAPTLAGALAIGGHGAALRGHDELRAEGHTFGSLSNLVLDLTAVVWDDRAGRYVLRTFRRDDPELRPMLVHLGRAVVTDVTLRVGKDVPLRCVSRLDLTVDELFAAPGSAGRLFQDFVDEAGRVEAIWFPFTGKPWLKIWSAAPRQPAGSRSTAQPYNYPFSDRVPGEVSEPAGQVIRRGSVTPEFSAAEYSVALAGLRALDAFDLWGPAMNTQLYIRASTLRFDESGYGVTCRRADVQKVLHLFFRKYRALLSEHQARGEYPMNGAVEVRACAIDDPGDVGVADAQVASLACTAPWPDRPEWDTVVWLNMLTQSGTPGEYAFYRAMESWTIATFDGRWAHARPEWSKGWAFTDAAAWRDDRLLSRTIPSLVSAGRPHDHGFHWSMRQFDRHDPHRVFSNRFLDRFAP